MHHQHHHPHASFRQQQKHQSGGHYQIPGPMFHPHMSENFHLSWNHMDSDVQKGKHCKTCTSDDDEEMNLTEDANVCLNEDRKGKNGSLCHRMKWSDAMVKLLITTVSYVGEDVSSACCSGGRRRKYALLQKKVRWRAISKVMSERGCYVSPQQCEDKFNDLNKRYMRLTDILGWGTSCKVVENPSLLDRMNTSEKLKDDARKNLSSKRLFYEEMCSYNNGNNINLPPDPALQHSLLLAHRNRDDGGARTSSHEEEDDDQSADTDEQNTLHGWNGASCFGKMMNLGASPEELGFENASGIPVWMSSQSIHLEEKRLQIQAQLHELEKQRFRWQLFSNKKDRELNKMMVENERMKLENERLSLELRHKELEVDPSLRRNGCKI